MSSEDLLADLEKYRKDGDVITFYQNCAELYDNFFENRGYLGINEYAALTLKQCLLEEPNGSVENLEILDVACGTGLSGEALKKADFKIFDGIDGSQRMIDLANKKKIYRNLSQGMLTKTENFNLKDGGYKGLSAVGCIGAAHIDLEDAIPEFYRLLKHGGVAVYTISPTLDSTKALESHLKYFHEKKFELLKVERRFFVDLKDGSESFCHIYAVRKC